MFALCVEERRFAEGAFPRLFNGEFVEKDVVSLLKAREKGIMDGTSSKIAT